MRYIDFDGVILDTDEIIFAEWRKNIKKQELTEDDKIEYIKNANWEEALKKSAIINNSISILKNMDTENTTILTKIHSSDNEGYQKVKFLREQGVKQNIIVVPHRLKKTDVVNPKDNILIDDSLKNLTEWYESGGYPMFFDKKKNNIDTWGQYNDKGYQRVNRIDEEKNH